MQVGWLQSRHESVALALENAASALDAGLPPATVLADLPAASTGVSGPLAPPIGSGLRLAPTETAALEAAEASGSLAAGLRTCAHRRRQRADLEAQLWRGLRYPVFLLLFAALTFGLLSAVQGRSWFAWCLWLAPFGVLGAAVWAAGRLVQRPDFYGGGIPGLRALLEDAGEIPYLEAMAHLYGAGIPLLRAHELALRAVKVGAVRARLFAASGGLGSGQPLAESLAAAQAVGAETLQILGPAERAGDLEHALERALRRRQDTFQRRATLAVRLVGWVVYAGVAAAIAWQVFAFYGQLYGGLRR